MNEQVFTRLPGETEAEARQRLAFLRGEAFKTKEERINEERTRTEITINRLKAWK